MKKYLFTDFDKMGIENMRRLAVMTYAYTPTSFDQITDEKLNISSKSKEFQDMYNKLPAFTEALAVIPDPSINRSKYDQAVEKNAEIALRYMAGAAPKVLNITKAQADILVSPKTFSLESDSMKYDKTLTASADMWAAFNPLFRKVVSAKMQLAVDLRDRYKGLTELTTDDIAKIDTDVRKCSFLRGEFSKFTSSRDYIMKTTKEDQLKDKAVFESELYKASMLARIVSLTVENIPATEIFSELLAFKQDVKNEAKKKALDDKVLVFINKLIKECKEAEAAGGVYDLDAKLK